MTRKLFCTVTAIVALYLLGARPTLAAPMLCSGEEKTCLALCAKYGNSAYAANCASSCRASLDYCKHNGCWTNGTSRYCGLMRK